jgi:hypothetical protein
MTAPVRETVATPMNARPERYPETPEATALALLYLIVDQDRSLTSRTSNLPVAAYLLDLYAECLRAASGDRKDPRGPGVRDTVN